MHKIGSMEYFNSYNLQRKSSGCLRTAKSSIGNSEFIRWA